MLRLMVLYDITDDRRRNKIVDICLDYGLDRTQYSVFAGQLKARQIRALSKELRHQIDKEGYVLIIPIASDDWERRITLGSPIHA